MKRLALVFVLLFGCGGAGKASTKAADSKTSPRMASDTCTTGKEPTVNEEEVVGRAIARICIEGGSKETKKAIDDAFALHGGSIFTPDALRTDLESAYATGVVDEIRVHAYGDAKDARKIFLVVQVHDRPKIASLTIEGAKANSNAELQKAFPLKAGDTYRPSKLRAHIVELRDGYHAAGFKHVKIEPIVEPTNDDRVTVKLVIKEE